MGKNAKETAKADLWEIFVRDTLENWLYQSVIPVRVGGISLVLDDCGGTWEIRLSDISELDAREHVRGILVNASNPDPRTLDDEFVALSLGGNQLKIPGMGAIPDVSVMDRILTGEEIANWLGGFVSFLPELRAELEYACNSKYDMFAERRLVEDILLGVSVRDEIHITCSRVTEESKAREKNKAVKKLRRLAPGYSAAHWSLFLIHGLLLSLRDSKLDQITDFRALLPGFVWISGAKRREKILAKGFAMSCGAPTEEQKKAVAGAFGREIHWYSTRPASFSSELDALLDGHLRYLLGELRYVLANPVAIAVKRESLKRARDVLEDLISAIEVGNEITLWG